MIVGRATRRVWAGPGSGYAVTTGERQVPCVGGPPGFTLRFRHAPGRAVDSVPAYASMP